ncbi:hypothetical protein Tco_0478080 [Tanacetum coccineum]
MNAKTQPPKDAACTDRDIRVGMPSGFEKASRIPDTPHTEYAHVPNLGLRGPKISIPEGGERRVRSNKGENK